MFWGCLSTENTDLLTLKNLVSILQPYMLDLIEVSHSTQVRYMSPLTLLKVCTIVCSIKTIKVRVPLKVTT